METDTYVNRTYAVWDKSIKNRASFRPSTPANTLGHAVDNQMAYEPAVHRPVFNDDPKEKERADVIEPFVWNVLNEASLMEPNLVFKQAGRNALEYGYAVLEGPFLDLSSRPVKPEKGADEDEDEFQARQDIFEGNSKFWNPFRIRAPHPASVLMDPMDKQPFEAIKVVRMTHKAIFDLSVHKKKTRRISDLYIKPGNYNEIMYSHINVWHYWNLYWHTVVVAGTTDERQAIFTERNTAGFVPFIGFYAGFGGEITDASVMDPKYMAMGILDDVKDSIRVQAQNFSARHQLLMNQAYAPTGTTLDPLDVARAMENGEFLEGHEGSVWTVKVNEFSRWMMEAGHEVDRDIEDGTYARVLAGRREQGVSTVGQQQIMTSTANKKFNATQKQLEQAGTIIGRNVLRLAESLTKIGVTKLNVGGAELKLADIRHNYNVQVRFELIDPVIDLQKRNLGLQEYGAGLISGETYRSNYARIEDEHGERKRMMQEAIRRDPFIIRQASLLVAEEMGLRQVLEQKYREEDEAAAAAAGQGGGGGGGEGAKPGLTDDIPKTPQSTGAASGAGARNGAS